MSVDAADADADVTAAGAGLRSVVVTAREDLEITRQVVDLLKATPVQGTGPPSNS